MASEIFEKVVAVLVESLACDEDQITPSAKLKKDLGCERIDFLDIAFRLSRDFGIRLDAKELFPKEKAGAMDVNDIVCSLEKALLPKVSETL